MAHYFVTSTKVLFITHANYDDCNKYLTMVNASYIATPASYFTESESKTVFLDRDELIFYMNNGYQFFALRMNEDGTANVKEVARYVHFEDNETYFTTNKFCSMPCDNLCPLPEFIVPPDRILA